MSPATRLAVFVLAAYQRGVSPALGMRCRFAPTCSNYARTAIIEHGLLRGFFLTLWRLMRCQPFHPGGYDPPPPRRP